MELGFESTSVALIHRLRSWMLQQRFGFSNDGFQPRVAHVHVRLLPFLPSHHRLTLRLSLQSLPLIRHLRVRHRSHRPRPQCALLPPRAQPPPSAKPTEHPPRQRHRDLEQSCPPCLSRRSHPYFCFCVAI